MKIRQSVFGFLGDLWMSSGKQRVQSSMLAFHAAVLAHHFLVCFGRSGVLGKAETPMEGHTMPNEVPVMALTPHFLPDVPVDIMCITT